MQTAALYSRPILGVREDDIALVDESGGGLPSSLSGVPLSGEGIAPSASFDEPVSDAVASSWPTGDGLELEQAASERAMAMMSGHISNARRPARGRWLTGEPYLMRTPRHGSAGMRRLAMHRRV